jgi:hypothetical protein
MSHNKYHILLARLRVDLCLLHVTPPEFAELTYPQRDALAEARLDSACIAPGSCTICSPMSHRIVVDLVPGFANARSV